MTPNTTRDGQLACAYGELWLGPHFICAARTEAVLGYAVRVPDWSHLAPKQLAPCRCAECQPIVQRALWLDN